MRGKTLHRKLKQHRISARLDQNVADKLARLVRRFNSNTSATIARLIEEYYAQDTKSSNNAEDILIRSDLIGCVSGGDKNISKNYKDILGKALTDKYDHR